MRDPAKGGMELLDIVLRVLPRGRYYTHEEILTLLDQGGYLTPADLEFHSGGNETKVYRRLQNALRDGAKTQQIEKNKDSRPYQYRVTP